MGGLRGGSAEISPLVTVCTWESRFQGMGQLLLYLLPTLPWGGRVSAEFPPSRMQADCVIVGTYLLYLRQGKVR